MAKGDEKALNTDIPAALADEFDRWLTRGRGKSLSKKIAVALAVFEFMRTYRLADADTISDRFDAWLERGGGPLNGQDAKAMSAFDPDQAAREAVAQPPQQGLRSDRSSKTRKSKAG